MNIYVYIGTYELMYTYKYTFIYVSLSLYVYIYKNLQADGVSKCCQELECM